MGTQLPPWKGAQQPPTFRPIPTVAKRSPISAAAKLVSLDSIQLRSGDTWMLVLRRTRMVLSTGDFTVQCCYRELSACGPLSHVNDCGNVCKTLKGILVFLPEATHLSILIVCYINMCSLLLLCTEPRHWVCKPAYLVPVPRWDKVVGLRQEGYLVWKWGMMEVGRWLVRMQWRPARWLMCLPLLFSLVHESPEDFFLFFWHQLTRVVPEKGYKTVVCVLLSTRKRFHNEIFENKANLPLEHISVPIKQIISIIYSILYSLATKNNHQDKMICHNGDKLL